MEANDELLKAKIIAERGAGTTAFASTKWTGLLAFRKPTLDEYLDYLGAVVSPHESNGSAAEQVLVDCLIHPNPEDKEATAKARATFKHKPRIVSAVFPALEAVACGDFEPMKLDAKTDATLILKLSQEYEWGWSGLDVTGFGRVIMSTSETAGTLVRVAFDARQRGDSDNGRKCLAAVLAMVKSHPSDVIENLLKERPALLIPLWALALECAGAGDVELGKG